MKFGEGHHIAGERVRGTGESFTGFDPRDGSALPGTYFDATGDQVDAAMAAATAAHLAWRRAPREQRAALLDAIAAGLDTHGDALTARASAETGLPPARLVGERGRTTAQLRMFAAVAREGAYLDARIDRGQPERTPLPRPDLRRMMMPIGPVVIFGASNFPLAFSVAGGDTASALAAGCPVVAKAHPAHPGTSELVAQIITEAVAAVGAPAGVFSCVQGRSHSVGERLVIHPQTRAVGFTGSLVGGTSLCASAALRPQPIPVFAEMGSINPVLLLPQALAADPAGLADAQLGSMTLGVGQFCTNPGVVLALASEATEAFLGRLAERASGHGGGTMLHAGIASSYAQRVQALTDAGATALVPTADVTTAYADARPMVWRVAAKDLADNEALREECFGPATLVAVASTTEELLDAVRSLSGQLTATIHATDEDAALVELLLPELEERVGRVLFGGFPTGVEVAPAMHHGGPWPATSDARFTSVGTAAIDRFVRPICWQNTPAAYLPPELHDDNPLGIPRRVDGVMQ